MSALDRRKQTTGKDILPAIGENEASGETVALHPAAEVAGFQNASNT